MLHSQAVAAYSVAAGSALTSVVCTLMAFRQPWFERFGSVIYLSKICDSSGQCAPFPDRDLCQAQQGFCASWHTAVFGLALTISLDVVVALAVLFSWLTAKRKKTATAVKYLSGASLGIDLIVLVTMLTLYQQVDHWEWLRFGGISKLATSTCCLLLIYILMFFFRDIIKGPEEEDWDSDFEDDSDDDVSIDEDLDLAEDERDFYIFNKRARRQALRGH